MCRITILLRGRYLPQMLGWNEDIKVLFQGHTVTFHPVCFRLCLVGGQTFNSWHSSAVECLSTVFPALTLRDQDCFTNEEGLETLVKLIPDIVVAAALRDKWSDLNTLTNDLVGNISKDVESYVDTTILRLVSTPFRSAELKSTDSVGRFAGCNEVHHPTIHLPPYICRNIQADESTSQSSQSSVQRTFPDRTYLRGIGPRQARRFRPYEVPYRSTADGSAWRFGWDWNDRALEQDVAETLHRDDEPAYIQFRTQLIK